MISRRGLIGAALALPLAARAQTARLKFSGSFVQGSLVIGRAEPGAAVDLDGKPLRPAADGAFAFGIGFEDTAPHTVTARFADGTEESHTLAPRLRQYEVQRIDGLPEETVAPDPALIARIEKENADVFAARATDSDETGFAGPFAWPAFGILSGVFGSRRILNGKARAPHFGVDIAAPTGTPIRAPAAGVVRLAVADMFLTGGTTVIDHGHGVSTSYFHQSAQRAKVGQKLRTGEIIGEIGATGRATGPHLHWAMNWFDIRLDPSRATAYPVPPMA